MTRRFGISCIVSVLLSAVVAAQEAPKAPLSVAGKWVITLVTENFTATSGLELKQDGEKITGTYTSTRYGPSPLEGTLKGRTIEFAFTLNADGTSVAMSYKGEVAADGQTMKGKASLEGLGEATWTAERPKENLRTW
jgi:hypothetical protein